MFVLTLSSYNEEDGPLDDLVGVFDSLDKAIEHATKEWHVPFIFHPAITSDDGQICRSDGTEDPEVPKPGLVLKLISKQYLDNGWGGRYFYIWETTQ